MKKIAVIQDLSGLGKCSLTAAIPVISAMGVQACPMPTAILSNQTGYESYYLDDYTEHMDAYMDEWEKRGFVPDGIYTGFLGSVCQVEKILKFLEHFCKEGTKVLVDPVMGDNGKVYKFYTGQLAEQMKKLCRRANVLTPNLTEALILLGGEEKMKSFWEQALTEEKQKQEVETIARRLKEIYACDGVIITGINICGQEEKMANLVCTDEKVHWCEAKKYGGSYSGTGDLFASVISAGMVKGDDLVRSVKKAVSFLEKSIRDAKEEGTDRNDGVCFETYLSELWKEGAEV